MRCAAHRPGRGAKRLSGHAPARAAPALLRVVGPPGSGKTLLVVSLTEELRRRGHRVGYAEARTGALVLVMPSGGRVTAAPLANDRASAPTTLLALKQLARNLDPQLTLLLVDEPDPCADGGTVPAIEFVAPGDSPRTEPDRLLAVLADTRAAGAGAAPGDTAALAVLVERRLLGAATGSSLDVSVEPPPAGRVRNEVRGAALLRDLGKAIVRALATLRRGGGAS